MTAKRIDRRQFVRISGAAAAVAGTGLDAILAARRAPAYAQGAKLHLTRWVDFVPAGDEVMAKLMTEGGKALGAEITLERINANDLQPRITAAVSSGSGPDIFHMKDGWIQQVGEPLELYGRPANRFVAGFIGSPSMNFVDVTVADANGALWADTPGLRVKVPPASASRLGPYKGQRVTLGIRPEDLRVAAGSDSADYSFDTAVEVVEPLGSEILLDLKAGPNVMRSHVPNGIVNVG